MAKEEQKGLSDLSQIKFYLKRDEEKRHLKESDNPNKLLLTSQIYGDWSFCGVMRNLAKGLNRNGVDVSIAPVEYHYDKLDMTDWEVKEMINKPNDYWNRTVLRSCEGDHMYLMPPGKQRIAHTTGESNRINQDWVFQLNNVDKVLTTSNFFKKVMIDGGVKKPVFVLPNSVNLDLFTPKGPKLHIDGLRGFNFLSMFHFGSRKAPDILIKAFHKAFQNHEDTTLTIHSLSMTQNIGRIGKTIPQYIADLVGERKDNNILITSSYINDALVPMLMRNYDVFVLPTRAEGFGLPLIETAALEIPSIVTGYSGCLDIVDNTNGWLIDYDLEDIPLNIYLIFKIILEVNGLNLKKSI